MAERHSNAIGSPKVKEKELNDQGSRSAMDAMNQARDLQWKALPVYSPVTREGEVELARQFEKGELLILEALLSSGLDRRSVFVLSQTAPKSSASTERQPGAQSALHRLEGLMWYLEQLERLRQRGLSKRERQAALQKLVRHRDLARRLLAFTSKQATVRARSCRNDPRIRTGSAISDAAREALLQANIAIVVRLAQKHLGRGLSLQDLIQEGFLGLMRAIPKFDYRLGHRFVTYAAWWVRAAISRAVAGTSREIRLPSHVVEMQRKLGAARDRLTTLHGDSPADETLAQYLEIPLEAVELFTNVVKQPLRFEQQRDQDGDNDRTLGSLVADDDSPLPEEVVAHREIAELALRMLERLLPREREILCLRFGIGQQRGHTLREVGDRFGLSHERARQIERAALDKLRQAGEALKQPDHQ